LGIELPKTDLILYQREFLPVEAHTFRQHHYNLGKKKGIC